MYIVPTYEYIHTYINTAHTFILFLIKEYKTQCKMLSYMTTVLSYMTINNVNKLLMTAGNMKYVQKIVRQHEVQRCYAAGAITPAPTVCQ